MNDYLSESITVGGLLTTREQLISDMQVEGIKQIYIDRYIQGLDLSIRIRGDSNEK